MRNHSKIYLNKYSEADWDIMAQAFELAFDAIGRSPLARRDRLAHSIMHFFDRGIHDAGVLSTVATNRETSLIARERKLTGIRASFASERPRTPMADYVDGFESHLLH